MTREQYLENLSDFAESEEIEALYPEMLELVQDYDFASVWNAIAGEEQPHSFLNESDWNELTERVGVLVTDGLPTNHSYYWV